MNRVHRVFYFAVAVTFASAIIAPGSVRAGPGDCTAYSATDIDTCFVDWAAATEFDAMVDDIRCDDDPSAPVTVMILRTGTDVFVANMAPDDEEEDALLQAFMRDPFVQYCGVAAADLGMPEFHICRAEILRSVTWRQLCAQRVDRSPQN